MVTRKADDDDRRLLALRLAMVEILAARTRTQALRMLA
jgi:hypothetical protein